MKTKKSHKNGVINQHYIPVCILKHFKESDDINNKKRKLIYHALHRNNQIYPSTINKVMARVMFYESPFFKFNFIENEFEKFETGYSRFHDCLVSRIKQYDDKAIKFSVIKNKAFDIVFDMIKFHLRSGAMMYELNYWRKREKRLRHSLKDMLKRYYNKDYILAFAKALVEFHEFCILKSNDSNFVISDQFMVSAALSFKGRYVNATNRAIGQKDVMILFPLAKNYYLCFYNGNKPNFIRSDQLVNLTKEQTEKINTLITNNSYIQTASPKYEVLIDILPDYQSQQPTAIYYPTGGSELRKEIFYYEQDKEIYDFISSPVDCRLYEKLKKNDLCLCGSGFIYGNCCRYKLRAFHKFMEKVKLMDENDDYMPDIIRSCDFKELNILEY